MGDLSSLSLIPQATVHEFIPLLLESMVVHIPYKNIPINNENDIVKVYFSTAQNALWCFDELLSHARDVTEAKNRLQDYLQPTFDQLNLVFTSEIAQSHK